MPQKLKERIKQYWEQRSSDFGRQSLAELQNQKLQLWTREINSVIGTKKKLQVLDIGTGSGYMALLLASQGHSVTGIDLCDSMIAAAKQLKMQLQLEAEFLTADAETLPFEDNSFDLLITRNLTWTLPNLQQAYAEWFRVLKPQGILLNFDADFGQRDFTCSQQKKPSLHGQLQPEQLAECNSIKAALDISSHRRPLWDAKLLMQSGFSKITLDLTLGSRINLLAANKAQGMFGIYAYK